MNEIRPWNPRHTRTVVFARLTPARLGGTCSGPAPGAGCPPSSSPPARPAPSTPPSAARRSSREYPACTPSATILITEPATTAVFYTDGLVERRDTDIGDNIDALCRRAATLAGQPLDEVCEGLLKDAPDHDDIAMLVLRAGSPHLPNQPAEPAT